MDSDTISLADPAARPPAPAGSSGAPAGTPGTDGHSPEPGDTLVYSPPAGTSGPSPEAVTAAGARATSPEPLAVTTGPRATLPDTPVQAAPLPTWTDPAAPAPAAAPDTDVESAPVFVDLSGRRRKVGRRAGIACGGLLAAFLVAMGIGVATGASVPGTPWKTVPGSQHHKKGGGPSLQPKTIPHGQIRPGEHPPGAVPPDPAGRTSGRAPTGGGSSAPSPTTKPSSSQPTTTPTPTSSKTHPGNGRVTPPGQTKRPKTTG